MLIKSPESSYFWDKESLIKSSSVYNKYFDYVYKHMIYFSVFLIVDYKSI